MITASVIIIHWCRYIYFGQEQTLRFAVIFFTKGWGYSSYSGLLPTLHLPLGFSQMGFICTCAPVGVAKVTPSSLKGSMGSPIATSPLPVQSCKSTTLGLPSLVTCKPRHPIFIRYISLMSDISSFCDVAGCPWTCHEDALFQCFRFASAH